MTQLTLQYRPTRFTEVVGQSHVIPTLRMMIHRDDVAASLLFTGSRGTGKTTCARILAAALNCELKETQKGDACGECTSCKSVQLTNSLAVHEIDAASNGLVDDIRKLKDIVAYSHQGDWRVILLDEAHSMSREAFNALLKVLEEPPPQTCFVLLTTEANKILETVRSRSMRLEFRRITIADILGRLRKISTEREMSVEDDMLREIAATSQGSMRDAVMVLDQCSLVEVRTLPAFREHFGLFDMSVDLVTAMVDQDLVLCSTLVREHFERVGDGASLADNLTMLVRDLLILKSEGTPEVSEAELPRRKELAARLTAPKLISAIRLLWELRTRVRDTDNDQLAQTELAVILLSEVLREKAPLPIQNGNGTNGHNESISLDRMFELAKG